MKMVLEPFFKGNMRSVKPDKDHTEKVQQIPRIDNSLGNGLKVNIRAKIAENSQHRFGQKKQEFVQHGQGKADGRADDEGNDLVAR
jgi:hypothetical protein